MNSPGFYEETLFNIYEDIKLDLIDLLNNKFDGHYIRKEDDPYIKQSNIIGTPIIYELKAEDGRVMYKAGLWSGNFLICTQRDYYELTYDCLFDVYRELYVIAMERS